MDFLKDFEKAAAKLDGVSSSSEPPRYWHSFGNHVLNYTISGNFRQGIPQGRLTGLAGPSGAGKSFVLGNLIRNAQQDGAFIFVIDSENALDDDFMEKIGVDTKNNYTYKSANTIQQVSALMSAFLKGYSKEYGSQTDAPKVLIALDSLDMLMTENEEAHFEKGTHASDMGARNKMLKAALRTFVQSIKGKNISMVCTSQVYKNQDIKNGDGVWVLAEAIKYSMSQIVLLTKLKLKKEGGLSGEYDGIRMKCQGYKTRFTKPFQSVTIEVPYETGIDPYSGLLDVALDAGVVTGSGWYTIVGVENSKRQQKNMDTEWYDTVLTKLEQQQSLVLEARLTNFEEDKEQVTETASARRQQKFNAEEEQS